MHHFCISSGYWDMAASWLRLVRSMRMHFRAAHGEISATFSKIYLYRAELEESGGERRGFASI
jgi:hypothetical protein